MRKLLSGGLAVFAGIVSLPSPGSVHAERTPPSNRRNTDVRLERLKTFFGKLNCPAKDYSVDFIAAAERYDLDWRLLPSLSFVETSGGKGARNNNLFGWDSGRAHFPSPAAGIHAVGYLLKHSSVYKNKTLERLLTVYNPGAEQYVEKVKSVMRRISPTE